MTWQPLQVVRSQHIDYLAPISADADVVDVDLKVSAIGRTSHTVDFTIRDRAGAVYSTGQCVVVTVDIDGRPSPIPDELRNSLEVHQVRT